MKTIEDLTPELREKINEYKIAQTKDLYSGVEYRNFNPADCERYVHYVYQMCKLQTPVVIIARDIETYKKYYNILANEAFNSEILKEIDKSFRDGAKFTPEIEKLLKVEIPKDKMIQATSHYSFLMSAYSRVYLMWYSFINKELGVPTQKEKELTWLNENVRKSNIARVHLWDKAVLVLTLPSKVVRNATHLHSITEGAIQYGDTHYYYLNGRQFPREYFEAYKAGKLTFEMFNNEPNEDIRGLMVSLIKESEGAEGLLKFLGGEMIDESVVVHDGGYKETLRLYKTIKSYTFLQDSKGNSNVPYAWLEETCPSTGSVYLIDTCPSFTKAIDAAKFARPLGVPSDIEYKWVSAN